ncbi:MAG: hypothetical protein KAJ86_05555 [Alphaproteobacteria bacterium]|nr:hypothetical protein [Alphaproteobacteria bacterium]
MVLKDKNKDDLEKGKPSLDKSQGASIARPKASVSDYLSGESKSFVSNLKPYLPQELVGGMLPHVSGTEEEAVWNAASQACGTEKVHYCYSIDDGRIWYLSCPSSSFASNPDSWCPLAAALPGNSEYWDRETVYLFEHEGIASALRWDPETGRMQVFLGASRTILPRVQSMDANFVTINHEVADIVPWRSRMLKTEQLSRATGRILVLSGLFVCLISAIILIFNYISINILERNLSKVKRDTDNAALSLMYNASNIMQSDTIKHMVYIQELLDKLSNVDGTLVRYEVKKGKVEWEALLPPAFARDFGKPQQELEKDGRVRVKNR